MQERPCLWRHSRSKGYRPGMVTCWQTWAFSVPTLADAFLDRSNHNAYGFLYKEIPRERLVVSGPFRTLRVKFFLTIVLYFLSVRITPD